MPTATQDTDVMHRLPFAATLGLLLCLAPARADGPLERAQSHLDRDEPAEAVEALESALAETTVEIRPKLLEILGIGYERAAKKAETGGRTREAAEYRENLRLLKRKAPAKEEAKVVEPPPLSRGPEPTAKEPEAVPEKPGSLLELAPSPPAVQPAKVEPKKTQRASIPAPMIEPRPAPVEPEAAAPSRTLARADRAWKEKRFLDAGAGYSELARADALPPERRDHWAYCRLVAVLETINAGPNLPTEWAEIHAEIDRIRVLSPKNWYGEYLRSVAVERSGMAKRPDPGKGLILRGASPEDGPASPKPSRSNARKSSDKPPQTRRSDVPPPIAAEPVKLAQPVGRPGPVVAGWQTFDTVNFRIFHHDEAQARSVAEKAEITRREASKRWTGQESRTAWSPRCEIYVYASSETFTAETGQPAEAYGFSLAGTSAGRIVDRKVKLRGDHPKMLDAVLPHEITHVVLYDLFPEGPIPRWADEGMAVLSEPKAEQSLRDRDLVGPLEKNGVFRLDTLMTADALGGPHRSLFYAQSISLTRFLVNQGTPPQFVQFVRNAKVQGNDAALRAAYKIDGVADLERRWREFARSQEGTATASASEGPQSPKDAIRR